MFTYILTYVKRFARIGEDLLGSDIYFLKFQVNLSEFRLKNCKSANLFNCRL